MGKVLCFGEILMRMSPDTESKWLQQNALPVFVGGAELNVASALACWEVPVAYSTAMPSNYLSQQLLQYVSEKNIDTSPVHFSGERIGTYYLPQGAELKNAGVIYDRAYSSFAQLKPGMIDWDKALDGISWFHFSAICPAVSQGAADVCKEALQAAAAKNITISIDLNFRAKLWQFGKRPIEIMPELVQYCDIVMGNVWAAKEMLGIPMDADLAAKDNKALYQEQAMATSKEIINRFPKCKAVANTWRFDHNGILYYTNLYSGGKLYLSPEYKTDHVIDKIGSGDCFMAGLIYGYYQKYEPQQILDFATTAAFQKLFIKGDATNTTATEVLDYGKSYADAVN